MKLSAFTVLDEYEAMEASHRLRDAVALAEAAESGGLHALWVAEHHFNPGGVCPSPPVLLAACGARTRRLRLGVLVSVLPFHRPVELAEQYAMVDRLTDGRLNLGVGSGFIPMEFEGFGVDPSTKRERFDRALETLVRAFTGAAVRFDEPSAVPVRLNLRPVQLPHPPLWIAVQRREAIPFVAGRGASIALIPYATLSGWKELSEEVSEYRARLPAGVRGEVAAGLHLYAGPHADRAREALQRYLDGRRATQSLHYLSKVQRDPHQARSGALEEAGWALFGTPRDVAARLEEFARTGVDEVLGIFDFGALAPSLVAESVRSLGHAFDHGP